MTIVTIAAIIVAMLTRFHEFCLIFNNLRKAGQTFEWTLVFERLICLSESSERSWGAGSFGVARDGRCPSWYRPDGRFNPVLAKWLDLCLPLFFRFSLSSLSRPDGRLRMGRGAIFAGNTCRLGCA